MGADRSGPAASGRARTRSDSPPRSRRPLGGLNARAVSALIVLAVAALGVAEPVRTLVAQRAEIGRLEAENDARAQSIADLEARQRRLQDPDYVARLARERLHFVMPGEVGFVVLEPGEEDEAGVPLTVEQSAGRGPWWNRLWQGVRLADDPSLADTPSTSIPVREDAPR